MGPSLLSAGDLAAFVRAHGRTPKISVSLDALAQIYIEEGAKGRCARRRRVRAVDPRDRMVRASRRAWSTPRTTTSPASARATRASGGFSLPDCPDGSAGAGATAARLRRSPGHADSLPANPLLLPGTLRLGFRGRVQTWWDLTGTWATASNYGNVGLRGLQPHGGSERPPLNFRGCDMNPALKFPSRSAEGHRDARFRTLSQRARRCWWARSSSCPQLRTRRRVPAPATATPPATPPAAPVAPGRSRARSTCRWTPGPKMMAQAAQAKLDIATIQPELATATAERDEAQTRWDQLTAHLVYLDGLRSRVIVELEAAKARLGASAARGVQGVGRRAGQRRARGDARGGRPPRRESRSPPDLDVRRLRARRRRHARSAQAGARPGDPDHVTASAST